MNIALITLFLLSLSAIVAMIGKKLILIRKGGSAAMGGQEEFFLEIPYIQEIKIFATTGLRRGGYLALVGVIRIYFRSANFMRKEFQDFKTKSASFFIKYRKFMPIDSGEKQEISKFLRTVSEYKEKLREIKHRIKEEENYN